MNIASAELYLDSHGKPIPFADYIARTRAYISATRTDLKDRREGDKILDANSPFELLPAQSSSSTQTRYSQGVLLIHGLLDSPFTFKDIGLRLNSQGIPSRAILLPGHGIVPEGLIAATYQQWIETVRYGIQSMRPLVDKLYLFGYSTGAALAIYHALQHESTIDGLVLLSPAIQVRTIISMVVVWHKLLNSIMNDKSPWVFQRREVDYAKYRSVAFNGVEQVAKITELTGQLAQKIRLNIPILIIASRQDDTISSLKAIKFFTNLSNPGSQFLLYDYMQRSLADSRITVRATDYPELQVKEFSHISLPFAPQNYHYGQNGDFILASHLDDKSIYGAFNPLEVTAFSLLYKANVLKHPRHELTYNPDFEFMQKKIHQFVSQSNGNRAAPRANARGPV